MPASLVTCPREQVPQACHRLIFTCKRANFWIFQLVLAFLNSKNIWTILEKLSHEKKNLNFDICKISLRKNLIDLKPLTLFSMEHVELTEQLFGWCKMELNIFFYLPNLIRSGSFIKRQTSGMSSDNEWQRVVQRVTTNDNEWQQMATSGTTNDKEWKWVVQRVTTSKNS